MAAFQMFTVFILTHSLNTITQQNAYMNLYATINGEFSTLRFQSTFINGSQIIHSYVELDILGTYRIIY